MLRVRRRDVLQAGALTGIGLGLTDFPGMKAQGAATDKDVNCILLFLVGGPSQVDTWDMKPDAPSQIRGPFRPIKTNVPGMEICEIFPRMARHADKYAILRSCYHNAAPDHESGYRVMKTGRAMADGVEHPHFDCVLGQAKGCRGGVPSNVRLRGDWRNAAEAFGLQKESQAMRERYGVNRFGQGCLTARRMIEARVRFVTVDMFETVENAITWDIHGYKPFSPMNCYRDVVGPMFDMAYSSLLSDLSERGLLSNTMVIAMGEFGRTPKINAAGGRDHWPECSSVLMAGGPIQGGQVVGSSDATGSAPKDRPISAAEIAATIYHGLGVPLDGIVERGAKPVKELFA